MIDKEKFQRYVESITTSSLNLFTADDVAMARALTGKAYDMFNELQGASNVIAHRAYICETAKGVCCCYCPNAENCEMVNEMKRIDSLTDLRGGGK